MRLEDLEKELFAIPGFKEGFDELFPYHDVSLELNGLRADLDMTQTEFGRLVGVPQSTVARLESGQQNPSVGMLQRIAKATGTELVVEFRTPKRKRRSATSSRTAPSPGETPRTQPVAASTTD